MQDPKEANKSQQKREILIKRLIIIQLNSSHLTYIHRRKYRILLPAFSAHTRIGSLCQWEEVKDTFPLRLSKEHVSEAPFPYVYTAFFPGETTCGTYVFF